VATFPCPNVTSFAAYVVLEKQRPLLSAGTKNIDQSDLHVRLPMLRRDVNLPTSLLADLQTIG